MNELLNFVLAFAVLTGPLWLILIFLTLAVWISTRVAKRFDRLSAKIAAGLLMFLIVFLAIFGDEIAGRIYFDHLCSAVAGAKLYKIVELPAEYWDERGRPKFVKANGDLDKTLLGNRFSEPAVKKSYSDAFGIDEYRQQVVDNATHETLGEVINFLRWGGWISRSLSPNSSAVDCKNFHENKFWGNFHSSLFNQSNSAK